MYVYLNERDAIFTERGQKKFLAIRDNVNRLLLASGAVSMGKAIAGASGDSWMLLACVDRLVELGEIREVTIQGEVAGQDRVFVGLRCPTQ